MREYLYNIIEPKSKTSWVSDVYDIGMMIVIMLSFLPLVFKEDHPGFRTIDTVCVSIFIVDYILRWITADYRFGKTNVSSFIRYPFSIMAIIDLLSILPSLIALNGAFRALRAIRLLRTFRVFRVFKMFRYSKNIQMLKNVFAAQRDSLLIVLLLAVGYIFISALVIFQTEPDTFGNFFDALYWATISLTTVGYGDIYATTTAGQIITMFSALMGIAIVALPAGIITAGYMEELRKDRMRNGEKTNEI